MTTRRYVLCWDENVKISSCCKEEDAILRYIPVRSEVHVVCLGKKLLAVRGRWGGHPDPI